MRQRSVRASSVSSDAPISSARASDSRTLTLAHSSVVKLSRSMRLPAWMGKGTSELKTRVPDAVKADFDRLAASIGMPTGELLRELILVRTYGQEAVTKMHAQRLAMVAGIGDGIGHGDEQG